MRDEPELAQRVLNNAQRMREGFTALGFNIGKSVTPVVPIMTGSNEMTFLMWKLLWDAGVFVNPIIHPAVQQGNQMLRL